MKYFNDEEKRKAEIYDYLKRTKLKYTYPRFRIPIPEPDRKFWKNNDNLTIDETIYLICNCDPEQAQKFFQDKAKIQKFMDIPERIHKENMNSYYQRRSLVAELDFNDPDGCLTQEEIGLLCSPSTEYFDNVQNDKKKRKDYLTNITNKIFLARRSNTLEIKENHVISKLKCLTWCKRKGFKFPKVLVAEYMKLKKIVELNKKAKEEEKKLAIENEKVIQTVSDPNVKLVIWNNGIQIKYCNKDLNLTEIYSKMLYKLAFSKKKEKYLDVVSIAELKDFAGCIKSDDGTIYTFVSKTNKKANVLSGGKTLIVNIPQKGYMINLEATEIKLK